MQWDPRLNCNLGSSIDYGHECLPIGAFQQMLKLIQDLNCVQNKSQSALFFFFFLQYNFFISKFWILYWVILLVSILYFISFSIFKSFFLLSLFCLIVNGCSLGRGFSSLLTFVNFYFLQKSQIRTFKVRDLSHANGHFIGFKGLGLQSGLN